MSASRLDLGGGDIDRSRPLSFTFDGRRIEGFAGDTIASALLASGRPIVGRSFKYHRPRGIWSAGVEEPNALVDIEGAQGRVPNARATTERALDGLIVKSVNASPSAAADRNAFLDRFARFIPAAFYYKTFMWPDWLLFEPRIRAMAGLGTVDPDWRPLPAADQINHHCDVLVVGAGPAGLAAAADAARAGRSVVLVDDQARPGGSLRHRGGEIGGRPALEWAEGTAAGLARDGHKVLARTTAFGIYDHNLVGLAQRHEDGRPDTLWRVRPRRIVLAAGAIERPVPFANNDLPGILSADAGLHYLRRHGVLAGRNIDRDFLLPAIASSVDLVVHCRQDAAGTRRVAEIVAPSVGNNPAAGTPALFVSGEPWRDSVSSRPINALRIRQPRQGLPRGR